jgi:putative iron-dependent peroxidase
VRGVLGDLDDIVKNVAFRDLSAALACTVGIGSDVWMPSRELLVLANCTLPRRPRRRARPATPGDLLLHIRANRRDLCFELERQLLDRFGDAVAVADETVGFRYFDARDLLGFVDGTANPVGAALPAATIIGGRILPDPVAATSWCRSTCTRSPAGRNCRPSSRRR